MSSIAPLLRPSAAGVPPTLLRRAMGHFATGVTVVTARDRSGRDLGTTANAVTSVSLDPPLVLVCLRHESETLAAIRDAGRFGVNVLRARQQHLSDRFARPADARTWRGVRHRVRDGVPLLPDALATLECELHDTPDGGDHAIVIGRVVAADHPDDHAAPLLYYRGGYTGLADAEDEAPVPAPGAGDVRLPSALGDLRILALSPGDDGRVSVAVSVGEPRGTAGALLHLHRGCLLGDALGSAACTGADALRSALGRMGDDAPGVVVYHRHDAAAPACCLAGGDGRPTGPTPDEVTAVRRAVRALELRDVRLLGTPAQARALSDAGIPISGLAPLTDTRSPE